MENQYHTIAVLNEQHKVYLVQHTLSKKIFVKKVLDIYNIRVYEYLYNNPIAGTPRIVNYSEKDGCLTIIEEYVSGESLQDKIQNLDLSINDILSYMNDICNILKQFHSLRPAIIHRDVKPSNVIITKYNRAVLLDFNAAKCYTENSKEDTVLLGTQGYAAPEQYGFGASSPQTDIYSIGILLKEMLESINHKELYLEKIIDKCTKMNPNERYANIESLKAALSTANCNHVYDNYDSDNISLIPPGFRTKTPWKMLLAFMVYIVIFWLCLTINFENVYGIKLWIERFVLLAMFMTVIAGCFNYMDIQRFVPLCKSKHKLLHYIGIAILNVLLVFCWFLILFIVEQIFFY